MHEQIRTQTPHRRRKDPAHRVARIVWASALSCVLAVTSALLVGQRVQGRTHRWWTDACVQRQLALSPEQVHELDAIFARDRSARIALHRKITRLDSELQRLIQIEADDDEVMHVSDDLEASRGQQNIRRQLMLLAMFRVLTPPQRLAIKSRSIAAACIPNP